MDEMVKVRAYHNTEKAALIRLIDEVCAEVPWMAGKSYRPTPAWEKALNQREQTDHLLYVLEESISNSLAGWCRLFPLSDEVMELGIGLHKKYRKRNLGWCLLTTVLAHSLSLRKPLIQLSVSLQNDPALRLFRRCDFSIVESEIDQGNIVQMERLLA